MPMSSNVDPFANNLKPKVNSRSFNFKEVSNGWVGRLSDFFMWPIIFSNVYFYCKVAN
jgi:hypothetical protein